MGKPTLPRDAANTGWVNLADLGVWTARAYDELSWYAGVMQWQYKSDVDGSGIKKATGQLAAKYGGGTAPIDPQIPNEQQINTR